MMIKELIVTKEIEINATPEMVWDAMINPAMVKVYLYGTNVTSDWKVGSPISFVGTYNDTTYHDKGNVLENVEYKLLKYNYWSGFSGLEDKPENYSFVTYKIEKLDNEKVKFSWIQQGFSSKEGHAHTENTLGVMLKNIKTLVEESN